MPNYPGQAMGVTESEPRQATPMNSEAWMRLCVGWKMDTMHIYHGAYAMRLLPGGRYDFFYGCKAGTTNITVWVYPRDIGKVMIEIFDEKGVKMALASNAGSGAWEQLSLSFASEKKVYLGVLRNYQNKGVGGCAWFDDLI